MSTIIVNLFGGPGTGKSTGAAYIFSLLKMRGVNAELVTEFAKDATWEENKTALSCQPYVFGEQAYRLLRCLDKVDVIVTDSPVLLSIVYNSDKRANGFNRYVDEFFNSFNNKNYFLNRVKEYNTAGRNQTESEANAISSQIKSLLERYEIDYSEMNGQESDYMKIANDILVCLGKEQYTHGVC